MSEPNTVLIIDDDSRNIFALKAVLKSKGFDVQSASSADEGLQMLRRHKGIKIVLLDMMMPDMDGYETLGVIRSDEKLSNITVFAVTAQAMMGDREKCLEAGANEYVSKPIDVDLLLDLLKNYN
jgi:CheY-like chemotaxis protein